MTTLTERVKAYIDGLGTMAEMAFDLGTVSADAAKGKPGAKMDKDLILTELRAKANTTREAGLALKAEIADVEQRLINQAATIAKFQESQDRSLLTIADLNTKIRNAKDALRKA